MTGLFDSIAGAKVYDLAQPYFVGMPHFPTHPPFLFSLTRVHGDYPGPEGHSSSAEAIGLGGHVGTHIDALCHFSYRGKLHGGLAISQSYSSGHSELTVDTIAPILRRTLLLDIAGLQKVAALPDDFEVTAQELDRASRGLEIRRGDVVLLRTGWAAYFTDTRRFFGRRPRAGSFARRGEVAQRARRVRRGLGYAGLRKNSFTDDARSRSPVSGSRNSYRGVSQPGRTG